MKIFILMFLFGSISICSAKEWRGIVPLKSTRADVEKILGRPENDILPTYYLTDEIVTVEYSKYGCAKPPTVPGWPSPPIEGWNVPPDTVLYINVTPRKRARLASLVIDLSSFEKVRGDRDVRDHFLYADKEAGFTIDLDGNETVRSYLYGPTTSNNNLRCSAPNE